MEATIDDYFTKIMELNTLCNNPLTTAEQLVLFFSQLDTICDNLDTEMNTMISLPITVSHFRKFILVNVERNNNSFIQSNLLKLLDLKNTYANEYVETSYPIADNAENPDRFAFSLNYQNQINEVKTTIKNIMNNCNCMTNRMNIIEKITKIQ